MTEGKSQLKEVVSLFIRLGFTAFGGPAAHIAMMEKEVVQKRQWMTHEHFLDLIGATNLIPGPNSTEMAIHISYERAGWKGLIIGGLCFIMPAVIITACLAYLYKEYGQLPQVQPFMYGIKPAIIAIIAGAVYPLAKKSAKNIWLGMLGVVCLALGILGINELIIMFGSGALAMLVYTLKNKSNAGANMKMLVATPITTIPLLKIFLIFLKIGAILYGSGYVLFAFLDSELVAKGLLSRQQLIDAIAVGQFTPGPVFSAVTFIGWQMNGLAGAAVATAGIFLPSFLFVGLLNPLIKYLRSSKVFSAFLDAVNIAAVALIGAICIQMGQSTLTAWQPIVIAIISFAVVFGLPKLNSAFIVLGSSIAGYLLSLI